MAGIRIIAKGVDPNSANGSAVFVAMNPVMDFEADKIVIPPTENIDVSLVQRANALLMPNQGFYIHIGNELFQANQARLINGTLHLGAKEDVEDIINYIRALQEMDGDDGTESTASTQPLSQGSNPSSSPAALFSSQPSQASQDSQPEAGGGAVLERQNAHTGDALQHPPRSPSPS